MSRPRRRSALAKTPLSSPGAEARSAPPPGAAQPEAAQPEAAQPDAPSPVPPDHPPGRRIRIRDAVLLVASVVVAIGALTLARIGVAGPPEAFTQLWLQDTAAGESPVVGVESRESAEMAYRLDLVIDGRTVSSSEFRLAPGQQRLVAAPGLTPGSTFEALLFLQASPDAVYRRVLLHVPTATAQPSGQDGEAASTPPS